MGKGSVDKQGLLLLHRKQRFLCSKPLRGIALRAKETVSYTHLDVYKRQSQAESVVMT